MSKQNVNATKQQTKQTIQPSFDVNENAMERAMRNSREKTARGKGTVTVQRGSTKKTVKRGTTANDGQYIDYDDGQAKFSRPICPVIVFADVQAGDAVEVRNSKGEQSVQTVLCVLSSGTVVKEDEHCGDPYTRFIAVPTPKEARERKIPAREILSQTAAQIQALHAENAELKAMFKAFMKSGRK